MEKTGRKMLFTRYCAVEKRHTQDLHPDIVGVLNHFNVLPLLKTCNSSLLRIFIAKIVVSNVVEEFCLVKSTMKMGVIYSFIHPSFIDCFILLNNESIKVHEMLDCFLF